MRMISDGDSNVYATILQQVPILGPYVKKKLNVPTTHANVWEQI